MVIPKMVMKLAEIQNVDFILFFWANFVKSLTCRLHSCADSVVLKVLTYNRDIVCYQF